MHWASLNGGGGAHLTRSMKGNPFTCSKLTNEFADDDDHHDQWHPVVVAYIIVLVSEGNHHAASIVLSSIHSRYVPATEKKNGFN